MKYAIFDHLEPRHGCDPTQPDEERLHPMGQADGLGIHAAAVMPAIEESRAVSQATAAATGVVP